MSFIIRPGPTKEEIEAAKQQRKLDIETGNTIELIQISMIAPTSECIYAPSRINPEKKIMGMTEFIKYFADSARMIPVSFAQDGISNPEMITAYSFGLNGWYIQAED